MGFEMGELLLVLSFLTQLVVPPEVIFKTSLLP
jgi:hypothetical protein